MRGVGGDAGASRHEFGLHDAISLVKKKVCVPFCVFLIFVFIFVGAFAANTTNYDLVVLMVFSALGFFMKRYGWPRAPLLLGVVLGKMMEMYLWLSYGRFGTEWLWRPGVIALFLVVIASLAYPAFKDWWEKRQMIQADGN